MTSKSNVTITIDYRETKLYESIIKYEATNENIKYGNLEIGDIVINCTEPQFNLIFERKTEVDLAASIKDGRYKEQKYRMLNTNPSHNCTYIIEGDVFGGIGKRDDDNSIHYGITDSTYKGAIIHTLYRDKMHVLFSKNTDETAQIILQIYYKCINNSSNFALSNTNTDTARESNEYIYHVKAKTRKIENLTKDTCYILQLCQIPGISQKIAMEISKIYINMKELIYALYNCPEEHRVHLISKIPMIGSKKAKIIVDYLI